MLVLLNCTGVVPGVTRDEICLEHGGCKTLKVIAKVLCKFSILAMISLHIIISG